MLKPFEQCSSSGGLMGLRVVHVFFGRNILKNAAV